MPHGAQRGRYIFDRHRFIGMMADAVATADEQHGGWKTASHYRGVVTGAADELSRCDSDVDNALLHEFGDGLVHRHRSMFVRDRELNLDIPSCCEFNSQRSQLREGRRADGVVRMSK